MPKLIKVGATTSNGGKVQVENFVINMSYFFSNSEEWDVSDLSTEEAEVFRVERIKKIQADIEPLAKDEFDQLMAMREVMNGE